MSKNLSLTRRQVLKGAGAAALTGAASLVPAAKASAARAKAPRWAYIVVHRLPGLYGGLQSRVRRSAGRLPDRCLRRSHRHFSQK